ncbi:MAG TPA: gas vesicle protein GvpD P-loop domain-containing protein [Nitrososphaeraceae archaeon]
MATKSTEFTMYDKIIDIPHELKEFVKNETYSLLIKGSTGTGKTTLALTILRTLDTKNFFYISTRNSPKQLLNYYPWLSKFVKGSEMNRNYSNQDDQYEYACFEDARLDEPESLFERITNQLMDVKTPIIIVDSWDSVASLMDNEARLNNERVLQTWRERAGAKLIFTTEGVYESSLQYLVDGVVELSYFYSDEVRLRELRLIKLRGIRIKRASYIFSLAGGILRCYDSYHPIEYKLLWNQSKIIKNYSLKNNLREIEHPDLDILLSGLVSEGLLVIEKDNILTSDIIYLFLLKIISKLLAENHAVIIDSSISETLNSKLSIIGEKAKYKIGIINLRKDKESKHDQTSSVDDLLRDFKETKCNIALVLNNKSNDIYGSYDFSKFQNQGIKLIIIIREKTNSNVYPENADLYLKFVLLSGSVFLKSICPTSHMFGIRLRLPECEIDFELLL